MPTVTGSILTSPLIREYTIFRDICPRPATTVKRILLVSPDSTMNDELTFLLQHSGYRVARVTESVQAMIEMDRSTPDVIVMRENRRRVNGDELCIRIRESSSVPIIVLGNGREQLAGVEMLEMGADAYLTSPLDPRELLARIRALLRRGGRPPAN